MPIAISVNMLRLRVSSDCQPRTKNGQPAHSTTGVANTSWIQFDRRLVDPAVTADQVAAHLQDHRREREHQADPEAARHVGKFGIGRRIEAGDLGLQRHAADRAIAGTDLADLRMHRAGVDRAFGTSAGFVGCALVEILRGSATNLVRHPAEQK